MITSFSVVYFVFVIGIGWALKRYMKGSADFFLSGRSIPAWVTGLAFISANLGAQEVIGMAASGAKYGIMTSHFYWVGAIPAMVFLAIFMMPFYYGSKARSVPEYLKLRFDEKTRGFNAISFAVMTVFSSGISMHALAQAAGERWSIGTTGPASAASALIVLVYIFLGGLDLGHLQRGAAVLHDRARLRAAGLPRPSRTSAAGARSRKSSSPWRSSQGFARRHLDALLEAHGQRAGQSHGRRLVRHGDGLGLRALVRLLVHGLPGGAARHGGQLDVRGAPHAAHRRHSEDAFPALVILPGMIAIAMHHSQTAAQFLPIAADGTPDYNMTIPAMLAQYFPTGLLGIGFTALMASFMSGMAGNVTAFNTVWTYDIYQSYIAPDKSDHHYLWMGRCATVVGILISIGAAYLAAKFNNIMDMLQLVFGFVNAPLFATFLLGMFWKRTTGHGAFFGLSRRHGGRGAVSRAGAARKRRCARNQGRLDRAALHLPKRDGAELLDGHRRLDQLALL